MSEVYPGPCQTPKMKRFVKTVNTFWPLAIATKHSILDIWQGSEYALTRLNFLFRVLNS